MNRRIFVFGSNLRGIHGAGAAFYAHKHYGAQNGIGHGLTGDSYALPTKDMQLNTLPLSAIHDNLVIFSKFAQENQNMDFLLTAVGCGLAGYTTQQIRGIMPWLPDNVYIQARLAGF